MAFPFKIDGFTLDGKSTTVNQVTRTLPAIKYQGASYSRQAVDGSTAGRNQSGTMMRDMITSKDKWQLEFAPCTQEQLGNLLALLDQESFSFTYPNPMYTGSSGSATVTKTCYCGDRSAPVYKIKHTGTRYVELWGNLSFSIIEM